MMCPYLWMRPGPQDPAVGRKPPTSKQSRGRFREGDRRTDWPWHYPHSNEGKHVLGQVGPPPRATQSSSKASGLRSACVPTPSTPRPQPGVGSEVLSGCRLPLPQCIRHPSFLPPPTSLRSAGCAPPGAFQPAGHLSAPEGNAAAGVAVCLRGVI